MCYWLAVIPSGPFCTAHALQRCDSIDPMTKFELGRHGLSLLLMVWVFLCHFLFFMAFDKEMCAHTWQDFSWWHNLRCCRWENFYRRWWTCWRCSGKIDQHEPAMIETYYSTWIFALDTITTRNLTSRETLIVGNTHYNRKNSNIWK